MGGWNQVWVDAAQKRFGPNIVDVKTKEILTNAISDKVLCALHGDGERVYGFARDSSERNKNQIWAILTHKNGSFIIVNEASGKILIPNGRNATVRLGDADVNDKKVQWERSFKDVGVDFRNMHWTDCYLNLAGGNTNNYTDIYCHVSEDKGGFLKQGKWHRNASWKEKHLQPGEV